MIYCVEDDKNIRELILYTLESQGYKAKGFGSGAELFAEGDLSEADLFCLDIMLPGESGIEILKKLRNDPATADTPAIMLTARDSEFDKVQGLDAGADDYIAKPFGMMEFLARIRAVIRRTQTRAPSAQDEQNRLVYKDLSILKKQHLVLAGEQPVVLTLKEYKLLEYLMENAGIVLSREQMLDRVWNYEVDVETRTVDVHIRTLRQKLGPCGEYIETVRGVGYRIGGWDEKADR